MANGISTEIFDPERKKKTRENLYGAISSQRVNPDDYLQAEPERPELDEERMKQLRNLSAVSALGEGIGAVFNAYGLARNPRYAPVSSNVAEMGVRSFDHLANMDTDHRNRLESWRGNVLDVRNRNQQTRAQIGQQNAAVDVQGAQAKYQDYQQDAEANRIAEQAKMEMEQNSQLRDQDAWREAGLRLISQGQIPAGVAALGQGGLSSDQIRNLIEGRTDDPQTLTRRNMVKRYNELLDQIENSGTRHYTVEGDPMSMQARQLEMLIEQLGSDLYNPLYQSEPEQPPAIQRTPEEEAALISPANREAQAQGLDPEQVRSQFDNDDLVLQNRQLVQQIRGAQGVEQQRELAGQLVDNWQAMGLSQQQIEQGLQQLFGNNAQ